MARCTVHALDTLLKPVRYTHSAGHDAHSRLKFAARRHRPMTSVRLDVLAPAFDAVDDYSLDLEEIEHLAAQVHAEDMP